MVGFAHLKLREGAGVYIYKDGSEYKGSFKANVKDGIAFMTYKGRGAYHGNCQPILDNIEKVNSRMDCDMVMVFSLTSTRISTQGSGSMAKSMEREHISSQKLVERWR